MKRQAPPNSYEDRLTNMLVDDILNSADALVEQYGPPPDSTKPSDRKRVELWGQEDPAVQVDALKQMLLTTGVPAELMETMQIGRYSKSHPELIAAYSQTAQDPALADRLVKIARYPFRLAIYDVYDPKERVSEAERLNREWQKMLAPANAAADQPITIAPPVSEMGG